MSCTFCEEPLISCFKIQEMPESSEKYFVLLMKSDMQVFFVLLSHQDNLYFFAYCLNTFTIATKLSNGHLPVKNTINTNLGREERTEQEEEMMKKDKLH